MGFFIGWTAGGTWFEAPRFDKLRLQFETSATGAKPRRGRNVYKTFRSILSGGPSNEVSVYAPCVFLQFERIGAAQVVKTCAGMRVDILKWGFFADQVLQYLDQHDVLYEVGEIAGVKGMSIA